MSFLSIMNRCIAYTFFPDLFPVTLVNPCLLAAVDGSSEPVTLGGMASAIVSELALFSILCILLVVGVIVYDKCQRCNSKKRN